MGFIYYVYTLAAFPFQIEGVFFLEWLSKQCQVRQPITKFSEWDELSVHITIIL